MTRAATAFSLSLSLALSGLAVGCAAAPEQPGACASTTAATARYLAVDARLQGADGSEDAVDCATATVTQGDRSWSVTATTPSELDLAPGTYEVEVDWATDHCSYASAPVTVTLGDVPEAVVLDLCVELSGDWTCSDGAAEWSEEVVQTAGCTVAFPETGLTAQVVGHQLSGELSGTVGETGTTLEATDAAKRAVSCWRSQPPPATRADRRLGRAVGS